LLFRSQSVTTYQQSILVLLLATVIVGVGGIIGQLLLLRELLVVFYGNELTLGVILGSWLLAEAAGAYLAGCIKTKWLTTAQIFLLLLLGFAVLLPLVLFFSPGMIYFLYDVFPGEAVGIFPIFLTTMVLLAPLSSVHGAMFPLSCRLFKNHSTKQTPIGSIYLYETLGTLLGGFLFTIILAENFLPMELSFILSVLHFMAGIYVFYYFIYPIKYSSIKKITLHVAAAGLLLAVVSLVMPYAEWMHYRALQYRWPGQEVVHYENSPYGNLVVTYHKGEYTFFYDGRPTMVIPNPDMVTITDFSHLVMATHPAPERVLLLGSGPGGMLNEMLKHPLEEVYYVEIDPVLLKVLEKFPTSLIKSELKDPRVKTKNLDGRMFLRSVEKDFDLVVMGFLTPDSLQSNRLFSREFFSLVKNNLKKGGIFVFTAPGSDVYFSQEKAVLNNSLYKTVSKEFNYVKMIPGEKNIFLASSEPIELSSPVLKANLEQRDLLEGMFSADYLAYRLDQDKINWAREEIQQADARLNHDFEPAALLYALTYWGSAFSPEMLNLLKGIENFSFGHYVLLLFLITLLVLFILKKTYRQYNIALIYTIGGTGMTAMAFDLLLIFMLQSLYGFMYQMIGIIIAIFMGGAFLGGSWAIKIKYSQKLRFLFYLELIIVVLLLSLYGMALLLQQLVGEIADLTIFFAIGGFSLLAGVMTGAQFPLASEQPNELSTEGHATAKTAGNLYSADLLGGWAGGIIIAIFLFPALGLGQTLLLLAVLKIFSLAVLMYSVKLSS